MCALPGRNPGAQPLPISFKYPSKYLILVLWTRVDHFRTPVRACPSIETPYESKIREYLTQYGSTSDLGDGRLSFLATAHDAWHFSSFQYSGVYFFHHLFGVP